MFAKISWNRKLLLATFAVLAVLVASLFLINVSQATPPEGVTPEPIAAGQLPSTFNTIFVDMESGKGGTFKQVRSDVDRIVMVKFTVAPGGHFGWHQHGGPLWVVVASGTLGYYSGDDPTCTPVIFGPGSAFMDPGNVTHTARNEGADDVVIYVTFMLPEGGLPRIDADHPGICDFLP
jgi:quercetin dioxygenase-like cupin family protein